MPLILGTNSIKDTGFNVANSCRFNSGSSDRLHKSQSTGNQKTYTFSFWIKRSILGVQENIIGARYGAQGRYAFLRWNGDDPDKDKLEFHSGIYSTSSTSTSIAFKTNRVFRDTNAWYHIVVAVDSTQAAGSGNQFHIYVNGVEELSFTSATDPSENDNHFFNINTTTLEIGAQASDSYLNAYIAEFVLIDGQQLTPTSFGEFDEDSGIWKPIDVSGLTFGNNGFYLDFEDSSNLGNDANGGTDLTEANITAIDQSTDTCTNNFATMNPLDNFYAGGTFAEGNLQVTSVNTGYTYNTSTFGVASGKWYWEVKWSAQDTGSSNQVQIGIAKRVTASATTWLGSQAYTYAYQGSSGHVLVSGGNATGSSSTTYAVGDIISVALDLDNNKIHFAKNGTYTNSSDAAGNSGGVTITAPDSTSGDSGFYFPAFGDGNANLIQTGQFNFGAGPPYAISSGNTDGNGFGNFEYAVPSGFFALCTKNLAENG